MTHSLFADFVDDPDQYEAVERYWGNLVADIARNLGQTGEWPRWIPRHFADGTPMDEDGNPMWDGRSRRLDRAFRIIQWPPDGDGVELSAWLQSFEEEYEAMPREELVLNMSLSEESAELARRLLYRWMTPETTYQDMLAFIDEVGAGGPDATS